MSTLAQFIGSPGVGIGELISIPRQWTYKTLFSGAGKEFLQTGTLVAYEAKYASTIQQAPWLAVRGTVYATMSGYIPRGYVEAAGVLVRTNLTQIYTGTAFDGTYTSRLTMPAGNAGNTVYINGVFVNGSVPSTSARYIYTSTDGISWVQRYTGGSGTGCARNLAYASNLTRWLYVGDASITGGSTTDIMKRDASDPQGTWSATTAQASTLTGTIGGIVASPDLFIMWTSDSNAAYYGTDGFNWTQVLLAGTIDTDTGIIWTGSKFIYHYYSAGVNYLYSSTDGGTWTQMTNLPFPNNTQYYFATNGNGMIWARCYSASLYQMFDFYSADHGATWTPVVHALANTQQNISWTGQRFIIQQQASPYSMLTVTPTQLTQSACDWVGFVNDQDPNTSGGAQKALGYVRVL